MKHEKLNKDNSILKQLEIKSHYLLVNNYKKYIHADYNSLLIENILSNTRCHILAIFKNYLIEEDNYEYLRRFYKYDEVNIRIKKLCIYHNETSVIFPNYFPLIESKYLYESVVKKQRIIDEQQDLEDKKNNNLNKKNNNKKEEKIFTSSIYDELFNSSESVMRIIFGIDKNKYNLKKYLGDKKENNMDENNLDNKDKNLSLDDNKESFELKELIKELNKAEETKNLTDRNNRNIVEFNTNNKNMKMKPKLKLYSQNLNDKQKNHKKSDLLNNITNTSTSITTSFNNIKQNINNKNNKININNLDNYFITNNKLRINKDIINSIKKSKDKANNKEVKPNENKKNIFLTTYSPTSGLNFIVKNPLINNLINIDLNNNNKNNKNIRPYNNINYFNIFNNKSSFINNIIKFNSTIKYNKPNNINKFKKMNIINKDKSRNYNEIFKSLSNTINKSYRKKSKNLIRNFINPILSLSPLNKNGKNIFNKNNTKFLYNNIKKNIKSLSCNKHSNEHRSSNQKFKISQNKLTINEYNYKKYTSNINL